MYCLIEVGVVKMPDDFLIGRATETNARMSIFQHGGRGTRVVRAVARDNMSVESFYIPNPRSRGVFLVRFRTNACCAPEHKAPMQIRMMSASLRGTGNVKGGRNLDWNA